MSNKSLLDEVPVDDQAFPLNKRAEAMLAVVGACPKCGSPIYGPKQVWHNKPVEVKHSCDCFTDTGRKRFEETIETK